jgi:hypothetical protein
MPYVENWRTRTSVTRPAPTCEEAPHNRARWEGGPVLVTLIRWQAFFEVRQAGTSLGSEPAASAPGPDAKA